MGCSCPDTSYAAGDDDGTKYELGPAYEDYKNGGSGVKLVWKQSKSLMPMFIPDCCADVKADWTYLEDWQEHTVMLACFCVVAVGLLAGFLLLRHKQPLKFRDARTAVVLWFIIVVTMILAVMNRNMAGSSPSELDILTSFCSPPLVLTYYITKAMQLWFVHEWSTAKAAKHQMGHEKAQFFHKYRFLLTFEFFMYTMLFTLVITLVPAMYTLYGRETFADAPGENQYSNVRCSWWEIPEKYTVKKSDSLLCTCIMYSIGMPGYTKEQCTQSVFSVCFLDGAVPQDGDFCDVCKPTDLANNVITKECENFMWDFYAAGNCGHFSETPHQRECSFGIIADQLMGYICAGICFVYIFLNLLMIGALCRKRDEFGVVQEMLLACVAVTVSLFFQYVGLFPNYGGMLDWYYGDLGETYRAIDLFRWIFLWSVLFISFAFPLCLYAYRVLTRPAVRTKGRPPAVKTKGPSTPSNPHPSPSPSPSSSSKKHRRNSSGPLKSSEISSEFERFSATTHSNEDAEFEVERCINTPGLCDIYMQFAIESFHVENVHFLVECQQVLQAANPADMVLIEHFISNCRQIHAKFLRRDASMEINVASKKREAVERAMDQLVASVETVQTGLDGYSSILAAHVEQLHQALNNVYHEIRLLLSRDAWPRFLLSDHFEAYSEFIRNEEDLVADILDKVSEAGEGSKKRSSAPHSSLEYDSDDDPRSGVEMSSRLTDDDFDVPTALVMKVLSERSDCEDI